MFVAERLDGAPGGEAGPARGLSTSTESTSTESTSTRSTSAASPWPLTASGLAGALDGLLDVDPGELTDGELAEAMVGLRREQARLAAVVADLTAAFDTRQVHAADGARSATDWIAVRCRLPRPQAAREVREARRLRTMPTVRAALRAGDINPAHARVLCGLAGHPRAAVHFPAGEPGLVDHARRLRFDDWQQVVDHWLAGADPDGPEHKRQRDHDLRRFRIPTGLGGVGHPDGYLTPIAAETINEALARIDRELFDADWAAAREVHGDATTVADLARSPAQRRHDALVEMANRASAAPADGKRPAPLVTVMVDFPTLAGRVCQLAGTGTVIAPGDITALLAHDDTLIERVVADGANRVRDISTARNFRGILRRILEITHPRCDDPTCFVPAKDCEIDHIVPWSEGGPTSQDNGRSGCPFHNRLWYRKPHLRPPPRRLDLQPPAHDPSHDDPPVADPPGDAHGHDRPPVGEQPDDDPAVDDPPGDDPPGDDPPGDEPPGDEPPANFWPANTPLADRPRATAPVGPDTRPPDLVVTDGDTRYTITLAA